MTSGRRRVTLVLVRQPIEAGGNARRLSGLE
jgi:hypothetical protein